MWLTYDSPFSLWDPWAVTCTQVEENQHFDPKLKVIRHEGVRHPKPVVKAEVDTEDPLMRQARASIKAADHEDDEAAMDSDWASQHMIYIMLLVFNDMECIASH